MNKTACFLLLIIICMGCSSNSKTEKHQSKRDNIINVRDRIKEIVIQDLFINNYAWLYMVDNYLLIEDHKSEDELIHLFNKNDFTHIRSTALKGQGPGEITRIGYIVEDKTNRKFYVTDDGKYTIFSYDVDSVIADPAYLPIEKMKMSEKLFIWNYTYINDTLSIGVTVEPIGSSDFRPIIGKINMITGEVKHMSYTNPDVKKKRILFGVSMEDNIYVECHVRHDLMTICNLDEDLKYNIYGPKWDTETNKIEHYGPVKFCDNRIIALYSGENGFTKEGRSTFPTKFLIFDLEGNYLKTLETGYQIISFCYDKDNHRIIMSMDDDMQFAYLDAEGLLD